MRSGQVLGERYRLGDRLGFGGMGSVWRAEDLRLGRTVAVKVLRPDLADDPEHRGRFLREARTLAALDVPGIVRIHDWREETDAEERTRCYIVIEYVAGRSLAALLEERGRLPADATLDIVGQTARALHAAHRAGIVHRDVKPGNIIIGADDRVTLVDFGIAYSPGLDPLTEAGEVIGTPAYISPEYLVGGELTPASDVYSLGVVAYQCLAGRPPYAGTTGAVIAGHLDAKPPPLPTDAAPAAVTRIVARCLAREPGDRFDSADALAVACGAPDRQPGRWRVSRRVTVVAGVAALLLAAAGAVFAVPLLNPGPAPALADGTDGGRVEQSSATTTKSPDSRRPDDPEQAESTSQQPPSDEEPDPRPGAFDALASAHSGRCVGVSGASKRPGQAVIQYGLSWETGCGQANERWSWVSGYGKDGKSYKVVNENSGLCLTASDDAAGTEVVQQECRDSDGAQVWSRTFTETKRDWDYYRVGHAGSQRCLSNTGSQSDSVVMVIDDCREALPQQFRVPA